MQLRRNFRALVLVVVPVLGGIALVGCSAAPHEPTNDDKNLYLLAYAQMLGYTGDDALTKMSPTLQDKGISQALDQCETIRTDHAAAVLTLGALNAMLADSGGKATGEDVMRLAVRYLCPDEKDNFEEIVAEA